VKPLGVRILRGLLATAFLLAAAVGATRVLYPLRYGDLIRHSAARFGVDPALVASVIHAESRFRPRAVSPRGARGLMQVMPETGAWLAHRLHLDEFTLEDLFDPITNITLGTFYLSELAHEFGGDWVLTLAAYNGGRQNVKRWLGGKKTISIEDIPFPETRNYVRRVLQTYRLYRLFYRWEPGRGP